MKDLVNQKVFKIGDIVNYHSYHAYDGGRMESSGHKITDIKVMDRFGATMAELDSGPLIYVDYLSHQIEIE